MRSRMMVERSPLSATRAGPAPPKEGVEASIKWPVGINRADVTRAQKLPSQDVDVRIGQQRWVVTHSRNTPLLSSQPPQPSLLGTRSSFRHAHIAERVRNQRVAGAADHLSRRACADGVHCERKAPMRPNWRPHRRFEAVRAHPTREASRRYGGQGILACPARTIDPVVQRAAPPTLASWPT